MAILRNSKDRYGTIARLFHAAMAVTILANLALGLLSDELETGEGRFAALHATLGILTLVLLVARLGWRTIDPAPALDFGTPIERTAAHAGHLGLYALTLLVALSGWLAASAEADRIPLLGGVALPALMASSSAPVADAPASAPATIAAAADGDEAMEREHEEGDEARGGEGDELWEEVHEFASWALLALILLHAAAALMHKRKNDGTWERMFG